MKHEHIDGLDLRLQEAVLDSGLEAYQVAQQSRVSQSCFYGYLYHDITPTAATLMKISSVLGVSVDWLLGLSDEKYRRKK